MNAYDAAKRAAGWVEEHEIAPGIISDPTATGHERYTHLPSGRAVVRQPYMTDAQWEQALKEFCEDHATP